jgi:hypothetical protein
MRCFLIILLFTTFLIQNQKLEATLLPQPNDVQTALTLPNPMLSTQKGLLIATSDNLFLLKKEEGGITPTDSSVARITPSLSHPGTYEVINREGNRLATLTSVLNRMSDGNLILAHIKAQPPGTASLTYITKTGTKIAFSGTATDLENAAKQSTYVSFTTINNKPYALFQNGSDTIGTFLVTLAVQ